MNAIFSGVIGSEFQRWPTDKFDIFTFHDLLVCNVLYVTILPIGRSLAVMGGRPVRDSPPCNNPSHYHRGKASTHV